MGELLMSGQKAKRFKIGYHTFIILVAIGIVLFSVFTHEELERATMYILFATLIGFTNIFEIFLMLRDQKKEGTDID